MRKRRRSNWIRIPIGSAAMIAMIAACSSQVRQPQDENLANAIVVDNSLAPGALRNDAPAQTGPAAVTNAASALPDDRTPAAGRAGAVDPNSAQAAAELVRQYGSLIEQRRFDEASSLWGDRQAGEEFGRKYRDYRDVHVRVGNPGGTEGAAGSIYVSVPATFDGRTATGTLVSCRADATVRRVNDVPGSTAEQRRWHISAIAC